MLILIYDMPRMETYSMYLGDNINWYAYVGCKSMNTV